MSNPIFISYKRVDKDKVFPIKDYIEKHAGVKCWIDLNGIESDAQFEDVIIEAIDNCEVFLFCYSSTHAQITDFENDWTLKELDYAQGEGKRVVFINIDSTPLTKKFRFRYGQKQQVDATDRTRLDKLAVDIRNWMNLPAPKPADTAGQRTTTQHAAAANDTRHTITPSFDIAKAVNWIKTKNPIATNSSFNQESYIDLSPLTTNKKKRNEPEINQIVFACESYVYKRSRAAGLEKEECANINWQKLMSMVKDSYMIDCPSDVYADFIPDFGSMTSVWLSDLRNGLKRLIFTHQISYIISMHIHPGKLENAGTGATIGLLLGSAGIGGAIGYLSSGSADWDLLVKTLYKVYGVQVEKEQLLTRKNTKSEVIERICDIVNSKYNSYDCYPNFTASKFYKKLTT